MNNISFPVARVLEGINAAAAAGLSPVKVNMVVKRGVNDRGIVAMAEHFRHGGHILRFIEYVDVGTTNGWRLDDVVPAAEILHAIQASWPLEPPPANYPGEVASRYRYHDGPEKSACRLRHPAVLRQLRPRPPVGRGKLHTCLFANHGHDLRAVLRAGATDQQLAQRLRSIWTARAARYSEARTAQTAPTRKIEMSYIGGCRQGHERSSRS
jgi:GTP 3',8-cyclase